MSANALKSDRKKTTYFATVPPQEILPIVDGRYESSVKGIYVIGDLREKYARQIVLSAADGCTAALAAAHYVETRKAAEACELPAELLDA